jgi:hypothetical protein
MVCCSLNLGTSNRKLRNPGEMGNGAARRRDTYPTGFAPSSGPAGGGVVVHSGWIFPAWPEAVLHFRKDGGGSGGCVWVCCEQDGGEVSKGVPRI